MTHYYWNDWFFGWGWILWFGFIFLLFSSFGHWGYSYRTYRRQTRSLATDIINERYARGEITRAQFTALKADIAADRPTDAVAV